MTEEELWKLAFKKLVLWACRRHAMSPADAEEMVQDAIRLFIAAGGRANPDAPAALLDALRSNINGIAVNKRRKKATRVICFTEDGSEKEPNDLADPEQQIANKQMAGMAIAAIRTRVEDDDVCKSIILQTTEGIELAGDQAKALSLDVNDIYKARRRLKAHVEVVKKLMESW